MNSRCSYAVTNEGPQFKISLLHRLAWRLPALVGLLLLFTGPFIVFAADLGYKETETLTLYDALGTSLRWRATAWEPLVGDLPFDNPAARICFWHDEARKEQQCFLSEDQGAPYQSVEQLSLIQLRKNGKPEYGVLFVTRNLSPGIGKLRLFSIWAYDKQGELFVNILPAVRLSDLSEYKIFPSVKGRPDAIFVAADRIWKTGEEPLYGGKHQFIVDIYRRSKNGLFELTGEYITERKYLTVDIQDDYGVIKNEQTNIEKLVLKNQGGR